MVAQENLIELMSRVPSAEIKWNDIYPQLYLSGTTNLIIGYHDRGRFTSLKMYHTEDPEDQTMISAREKTQEGMDKLAAVLRLIRDAVLDLTDDDASGDRSERLLSLVCQQKKLKLYERTGGSRLPDDLVAHFCE